MEQITETETSVIITFDPSDAAVHRSAFAPKVDLTLKPPSITIPFEGELPPVPQEKYPKYELMTGLMITNDDTRLFLSYWMGADSDKAIQMLTYWIPKRNEWVGVWHMNWLETNIARDDCYLGPFRLNDFFALGILEAFGFRRAALFCLIQHIRELKNVLKMSPQELRDLVLSYPEPQEVRH